MVPVDYYVLLIRHFIYDRRHGCTFRRNPLIIFMSIELMLNAANLAFVAFARSSFKIFQRSDLRVLRYRCGRRRSGRGSRLDRADLQSQEEHQY
jgi:hypothetical protein